MAGATPSVLELADVIARVVACDREIERVNRMHSKGAETDMLGRSAQRFRWSLTECAALRGAAENAAFGVGVAVESSTAVQKARKLIEGDKVDFLLGNVNSAGDRARRSLMTSRRRGHWSRRRRRGWGRTTAPAQAGLKLSGNRSKS